MVDRDRQEARDSARVAARLSAGYILRSLHLIADLADGELLQGLVWTAVTVANVAHLDRDAGAGGAFAGLEAIPPDALRRPVSVLAISSALGLPYETTRRHVAKLVASGQCLRVRGGILVPARALDNGAHREMLAANLANLRTLVRNLRKAGVRLD